MAEFMDIEKLVQRLGKPSKRMIVAIAGAPGSGKSTFADALRERLNQVYPDISEVFPMDGYHYDDTYLTPMGWQSRKGAPHTFDVGGLLAMFQRLQANKESKISVPVFDRELEIARAGARMIGQDTKIIIAEGNYLLLKTPPWADLRQYFDLTIMLDVPIETIEARLYDRWAGFGYCKSEAEKKVAENDLLNVHEVIDNSFVADNTIKN